jgi:hypothetical protein
MKVFDFLNMFMGLTDEQKQLELVIEFRTPSPMSYEEDCYELSIFKIDDILEYAGYVVVEGK